MEIRLLEYVIKIYEERSFTKAAQRLSIAQPSLSQQIAKLEQELGVRLLHRNRGAVTPTAEGARFIEQAYRILQLHHDLEREMRDKGAGISRELAIGTTAITGGRVLPSVLQVYRDRFPDVHVQLVEASTDRLTELAAKGIVDIAILALPLEDARLATIPMLTEPLLLALPPAVQEWMPESLRQIVLSATALADTELGQLSVQFSELANAPFVLLKQGFGFRSTVLQLCAESGFQPIVAYETSSIETAQALAAHGLGVTLLPAMVVHPDTRPRPTYVALDTSPTRTLVFAHPNGRYLSIAATAFLEVFEEVYEHADGGAGA